MTNNQEAFTCCSLRIFDNHLKTTHEIPGAGTIILNDAPVDTLVASIALVMPPEGRRPEGIAIASEELIALLRITPRR